MVLQFYKENRQKKKYDTSLIKKTEQKQNSATIMISVDGKGIVFPVKLKLHRGNVWIKILKKRNFKKGLMKLIETSDQVNMTSDYSVSSNNVFKSHLSAKCFNMSFAL